MPTRCRSEDVERSRPKRAHDLEHPARVAHYCRRHRRPDGADYRRITGPRCRDPSGHRGIVAQPSVPGSSAPLGPNLLCWSCSAVRCVRTTDAYLWIEAFCLDTLCARGLEHGRSEVADWAVRLETLAARTDMREMLVRSQMHRAALGVVDAGAAARLFARDIDNPSLLSELSGTPAPA